VPIIFITAHGDIPMTVQAMKGGAIESSQNRSEIRIFSRLSRPASLAIVPVARAIGPWMSSGSVSTRSAHASGKS
jgi:hypothetical protein